MLVALTERTEPIATGEVLEVLHSRRLAFLRGRCRRDSHGSSDPTVLLIIETFTLS